MQVKLIALRPRGRAAHFSGSSIDKAHTDDMTIISMIRITSSNQWGVYMLRPTLHAETTGFGMLFHCLEGGVCRYGELVCITYDFLRSFSHRWL